MVFHPKIVTGNTAKQGQSLHFSKKLLEEARFSNLKPDYKSSGEPAGTQSSGLRVSPACQGPFTASLLGLRPQRLSGCLTASAAFGQRALSPLRGPDRAARLAFWRKVAWFEVTAWQAVPVHAATLAGVVARAENRSGHLVGASSGTLRGLPAPEGCQVHLRLSMRRAADAASLMCFG